MISGFMQARISVIQSKHVGQYKRVLAYGVQKMLMDGFRWGIYLCLRCSMATRCSSARISRHSTFAKKQAGLSRTAHLVLKKQAGLSRPEHLVGFGWPVLGAPVLPLVERVCVCVQSPAPVKANVRQACPGQVTQLAAQTTASAKGVLHWAHNTSLSLVSQ